MSDGGGRRGVAVLGSTGSVGQSTADLIAQLPIDRLTVLLHGSPLDRGDACRRAIERRFEPRAADHEVADDAHQLVEPIEIDAHNARRSDCWNRLDVFGSRRDGCLKVAIKP